ncbi:TetR/AcrR family transcriptional regulator [Gordonia crocea]|uniref:TetR family transcriptional regulator n=1 Tax=Gordonia crocea TaxID=589162 RepID=A0A7I9UYG7_9ACTN|nr:TetR/AcrR family transcriptional regulator C-terminal domain-containing protein [Gordonia crocea]GED97936.1 TetR family transcriptional regulator [Gordonia crocea]
MDTIDLLWRHEVAPARRGRPPRYTVDQVVDAAIDLADRVGSAFSIRDVAGELGIPVMSLYSYVQNRDQLVELMVDDVYAGMTRAAGTGDWRNRLATIAEENLELITGHGWLADIESERAILGPGTLAKYEHELDALDGLPLPDPDKDAALTVVLDFVKASARSMARARVEREQESPQPWWEREGAKLAVLGIEARFPLASRIGAAAGEAQGAARNARHAYEFGLQVILDGIAARLTTGPGVRDKD